MTYFQKQTHNKILSQKCGIFCIFENYKNYLKIKKVCQKFVRNKVKISSTKAMSQNQPNFQLPQLNQQKQSAEDQTYSIAQHSSQQQSNQVLSNYHVLQEQQVNEPSSEVHEGQGEQMILEVQSQEKHNENCNDNHKDVQAPSHSEHSQENQHNQQQTHHAIQALFQPQTEQSSQPQINNWQGLQQSLQQSLQQGQIDPSSLKGNEIFRSNGQSYNSQKSHQNEGQSSLQLHNRQGPFSQAHNPQNITSSHQPQTIPNTQPETSQQALLSSQQPTTTTTAQVQIKVLETQQYLNQYNSSYNNTNPNDPNNLDNINNINNNINDNNLNNLNPINNPTPNTLTQMQQQQYKQLEQQLLYYNSNHHHNNHHNHHNLNDNPNPNENNTQQLYQQYHQNNLIQLQHQQQLQQFNQQHQQQPSTTTLIPTPTSTYNPYVQSILNTQLNPLQQPSQQLLEEIYEELKVQFTQCIPEQIILLLYNNLIKLPREEMIVEETKALGGGGGSIGSAGDNTHSITYYNGGQKYKQQLNNIFSSASQTSNNPNIKLEQQNFELKKKMIHVYVTNGYGVKVFQDYMLKINPNQQPIDKDKFKAHFVNIYKLIVKKVEEFLCGVCDRQFQPFTKNQFHKTLGDVINCRKNFDAEFCQIFFRILQATFDLKVDKMPTQKEVEFFYLTILSKVRQPKTSLPKKLHQPQQQKDIDIWTKEFELQFIKDYIKQRSIQGAKNRLFARCPQATIFITDQKLKQKIQVVIRQGIRDLIISNEHAGNKIIFNPSDVDKKFIMTAHELQESRIKLIKVYATKPKDGKVLAQIIELIKRQLSDKYKKEKIPPEALEKSVINNYLTRIQEQHGIEHMMRAQITKSS